MDGLGEHVVYIVRGRGTDFWKIGRSSNILQRLVSLEENAPFKVDVCLIIGSKARSARVEEAMLDAVSAWRCHREWHDVHEAEYPAFFRAIDLTLRFQDNCAVRYLQGPAYDALDQGLRVVEDMGRDTYRRRFERPRLLGPLGRPMSELMEDHHVEDRLDYAKWHVCNRRGLHLLMEF